MNLILFLKSIIHFIVIGLVVIALASMVTCSHYRTTAKELRINNKNTIANLQLEYERNYRQLEKEEYELHIESEKQWQARETVIVGDAADARAAVVSLSDTVEAVTSKAASDAAFCAESTRVTGDLLKTCSAAYVGLAKTTDEFDNELRKLRTLTGKR